MRNFTSGQLNASVTNDQAEVPSTAGAGSSRRRFLRTTAVVAGAALPLALGSKPTFASGLDTALPSLYRGSNVKYFHEIQKHENDHVAFLKQSLGSAARPSPTFKNLEFSDPTSFARQSKAFENTGVGAYLGALPVILSRAYVGAAGSIALIEGRHSGWLDTLLNTPISPNGSFDTPLTPAQVNTAVAPFVVSLNGGPPLTYSTTPSAANDIAILNFALALEFLEAAFYNINVPKFS